MERQLFNPIVLFLLIAADAFAIYDLFHDEKKHSMRYKITMSCIILFLPLLGVSIYYSAKNNRWRKHVPAILLMLFGCCIV